MAGIAKVDFDPGTALPPPSEDRIRWFEESYRVKLPSEYLELLRTANGAVPRDRVFSQGHKERSIERFLPLLEAPGDNREMGWYDLTSVLTQLDARLVDREDLVGMNVIPIAALFGGDFVCLDYRGGGAAPTVAVWDHEQSEELAPHLEEVADSFESFLRVLDKPG
jgi:hypothetical protein